MKNITHRAVSKGSYSSDTRFYFQGTADECVDWVSQQEHPEYFEVGLTIAEQKRRDMCRKLFGEETPELTEREDNALDAALKMKEYYDEKLDKSAESTVRYMEDFVNNYSCPMDEFVTLMTRRHRTLQQSFTKLCFKWIEKVASPEYTHDGRNEASHRISKRAMNASRKVLVNWLKPQPDDGIHVDAKLLKDNPPSTWLTMV